MMYLFYEFLIYNWVARRTIESLLEESEEDGDDYSSFESLPKDDEENRNGEDVDRHGEEC